MTLKFKSQDIMPSCLHGFRRKITSCLKFKIKWSYITYGMVLFCHSNNDNEHQNYTCKIQKLVYVNKRKKEKMNNILYRYLSIAIRVYE